jgi:8-oxo-dGTP diphosphatase
MRVHLLARAVVLRASANGMSVLLAQQIGASHTFLPGGHIEPGEGLPWTLIRELDEELGVTIRVVAYLGAVEHQWPEAEPSHYEVNHVFLAELRDPAAVLTSREPHLRFFWCPVAALAEHRLSPTPLQHLIAQHAAGDRGVWWATTLPEPATQDDPSAAS